MKPMLRFSLLIIFFSLFLTNCRGGKPVLNPTTSASVPTDTKVLVATPSTKGLKPTQTPISRSFFDLPPLPGDVSKFSEVKRFGNGAVSSMELSPDGSVIAIAGAVGIWLYNRDEMKLVNHMSGDAGWVHDIAWSQDGTMIAAANDNGSLHIWNAKTGEIIQTLQQSNKALLAVSWSPKGNQLVSGGRDNIASIWDWKTGKKLKNLEGLNGGECGPCRAVTDLAWSSEDDTIATVTNRNVRIWDLLTDQYEDIWSSWEVDSIEWSPDGKYLAVGTDQGIHVLENGTWEKRYELEGWFYRLSWSPKGDKIAAFSPGGNQFKESNTFYSTVIKWDLIGRTVSERSIEYDQYDVLHYGYGILKAISWSPDGNQVIFVGGGNVWMLDANGTLLSYSLYNHFPGIEIDLSPDGEHIVTANGLLLNTGSELDWEFLGIKRGKVSWAPDGRKIAFFGPEGFRVISTTSWSVKWYLEDYEKEKDPNWHGYLDLAWSPDSDLFAVKRINDADEVQIEIWRFIQDQLILHGKIPLYGYDFEWTDIAWSPDGKLLAFFDNDSPVIYDAEGLQQVTSLNEFIGCEHLNWSPDGGNIAMDCDNSIVIILDSQTWQEYRKFDTAHKIISSIDWSPDGRYIVVGDYFGQIDVWDVAEVQQVNSFHGHTDSIQRVIWSSKGDSIVSSSLDGTIRIWAIPEDK